MHKTSFALLFFFLFLSLFSFNAYAFTLNYPYILDDAYILNASHTTNYGASQWLSFQANTIGGTGRSYIKFNLASLAGLDIKNATLVIYKQGYLTSGQTSNAEIYTTTLNWTEENITWDTVPLTSDLIENASHNWTLSMYNFSVTDAIKDNAGSDVSFYIKVSNEAIMNGAMGRSKEYDTAYYRPFLEINFNGTSDPCVNTTGYAGETNCVSSVLDPSRRGYVTNIGNCNLIFGSCPSGSICIQWSNTNPTLTTTPEWSINTTGCYNLTTAHVIPNLCTDNNGVVVNCSSITETNSSFPLYCPNTTTSCYTTYPECKLISCSANATTGECENSAAGWFATQLGSTIFGIADCSQSKWILAMISSLSIGITVLFYSKRPDSFIVGTMSMLVLFTLIAWFPAWVMIILIVISAFVMAKSLGLGGG